APPPGSLSTYSVSRNEVGTDDLFVWDRDDTVAGGDRDLLVRGADQLASQLLVALASVAQAHLRAAPQVLREMLGLGQRSVLAGRGNLERVLLAVIVQQARDPLAQP